MDTVHIQIALQNVNSFLRAYASDLLPRSIVQTGTVIVNTDLHREGLTLADFISKTPGTQAVTFSIPMADIHIFPRS